MLDNLEGILMFEIIPNWHPMLVHFTIGLLTVSIAFYALAIIFKNHKLHDQWLLFANYSLWLGVGFGIATATAGWFAYNSVAHDTASHAAMTTHRNWALTTLSVFILLAIWSYMLHRKGIKPAILFLLVGLVSAGLLSTTGWLGAEAVYRYGLGVMSLPKVEGEGHAHSHGDGAGHGDSEGKTMEMESAHEASPHEHADGENNAEHSDGGHEDGHGDQHDTTEKTKNHDNSDGHAHEKDSDGHDH